MKRILSYLAMSLMVGVLAVSASFADGKNVSSHFTLSEDLMVGGTVLEKGSYRIKFYGDSSELQIRENDGEVVKTLKVRVMQEPKDAPYDALTTRDTEAGKVLVSVKFEGDHRTILVEEANAITTEEEEL